MTGARYITLVACVALVGLGLAARVRAAGVPAFLVGARVVEVAPLAAVGDAGHVEVYVLADVRFGAGAPWRLNTGNFRLIDAAGLDHAPAQYHGVDPLRSADLAAPAAARGWLVFKLNRTIATAGSLEYLHGPADAVVRTAPFPLRFSPKRVYAVAVQDALQNYLLDEALMAGYLTMAIDPIYGDVTATVVPGADRSLAQRQRVVLANDRVAFDAVRPGDAEAATWRRSADGVFEAIDDDLRRIGSPRGTRQLMAWYSRFQNHDRKLAVLFQQWPGA